MTLSKKNNVHLSVFLLIITLLTVLACTCSTTAAPTLVATSSSSSSTLEVEVQPTVASGLSETPASQSEEQDSPLEVAAELLNNETDEPSTSSPTAEPTTSPTLQAYNVGDIVSIQDSVLVILGWEVVPGDQFLQPDEGKQFIAVDVLIVNQGASALSISSFLQMTLRDETGQKYDLDLLATTSSSGGMIDGELAPGERIRGKVGFQVPVDVVGLQFVYEPELFATGKVFVDLGPEPISVEPPAEIAGETEQQLFNVGDVVQIGSLELTVNGVTSPTGDQFTSPETGNIFVVVDITIVNKGTSVASVSTLLQTSLKDSTGQTYDVDIMASVASGGSTPDGELLAGERIRGQIGFEVPETATGLVFVFDGDVFGAGKVFVALPEIE